MEIIGKLLTILEVQRGESQRGPWARGGFVIETQETYPKKVAFTMFGEDKISMINGIALGEQINVHFSIESREYQGRWYTDIRAFQIDKFTSAQPSAAVSPAPAAQSPAPAFASAPATSEGNMMPETDDDLPF